MARPSRGDFAAAAAQSFTRHRRYSGCNGAPGGRSTPNVHRRRLRLTPMRIVYTDVNYDCGLCDTFETGGWTRGVPDLEGPASFQ